MRVRQETFGHRHRQERHTRFLDKGADVNVKDQDGRTLLMIAEEKGRPDSLLTLIKKAVQRKR